VPRKQPVARKPRPGANTRQKSSAKATRAKLARDRSARRRQTQGTRALASIPARANTRVMAAARAPSPRPRSRPVGTSDLQLPLVQFIQAHNTYAYGGRTPTAREFRACIEALYAAGARGIELDASQTETSEPRWSVSHDSSYVPAAEVQLDAFLREVAAWSWDWRARGGHEPLFVLLDLKWIALDAGFPGQIDAYLSQALAGCALFTPGQVLGLTERSLAASLRTPSLWPTLEAMRNAIILCVSGSSLTAGALAAATTSYAKSAPRERIAFADYGAGPPTVGMARPSDPNRVIVSVAAGKPPVSGNWPACLRALDEAPRLLSRLWWSHVESIGIRESIPDSLDALRTGVWCLVSDDVESLVRRAGWGGYRPRPARRWR